MTSLYGNEELEELRNAISRLLTYNSEEIQQVSAAVRDGRCPAHLAPFWSLAREGPGSVNDSRLYRKLQADPLVLTYSCYAFFPGVYERIYCQGQRPRIDLDGRTRGRVALFRFESGEGIVVKPLQSQREGSVARLAGEAAVGPAQFPSIEGFLVEDLVTGVFFTGLTAESVSDEEMYQVGRRLGNIIRNLHGCRIYYNDATISDPEGRSHLIVNFGDESKTGQGPDCRLIDFGVSVLLDNFPHLEPEEVFNLVRTTPEFRLMSRMGIQGNDLVQFLAQYRQRLIKTSPEEILARDLRFFEEGLNQASRHMGNAIVQPVSAGFYEGYG